MSTFPTTWELVQLKDIGEIVSGGTPSTSISAYWNGAISWVSPVDLSKFDSKTVFRGRKSITVEGLNSSSATLLPTGTVLFSSRAPIGYVAIAGNELCTNQGFKSIIPNIAVFNEYLYYYLRASKVLAEKHASGTTFKEISLKTFATLPIPLPPLAEQHRIVAKIEELFSELDKGIETLKTARQQLKTYRQAVLKWAFEGKLTNPDMKEGELPVGWEEMQLSQVGTWRGGGTPSKSDLSFWTGGTLMWVTPKDMKRDIIHQTEDMITENAITNSSAKLIPPNSVLIVVRSGILRRTLPISYVENEVAVNQDMQAITPFEANHIFLFYALKAKAEEIRNKCSKDGTTVESIETSLLKSFKVNIAPKSEQNKIVQEIESRLSVCDKVEESIAQGLQQAEALRQSILKKAFEGKLVPQDANDEPAALLLERIRAERAAAQPAKKSRGRNTKEPA